MDSGPCGESKRIQIQKTCIQLKDSFKLTDVVLPDEFKSNNQGIMFEVGRVHYYEGFKCL